MCFFFKFYLFISHGHLNCMLIVKHLKTPRSSHLGSVVLVEALYITFYSFSSLQVRLVLIHTFLICHLWRRVIGPFRWKEKTNRTLLR